MDVICRFIPSRGHNHLACTRSVVHCDFKIRSAVVRPKMTAEAQVDHNRQAQTSSLALDIANSIDNGRIEESSLHHYQVRLRRHADVAMSELAVAGGRAVAGRNSHHVRSVSICVRLRTGSGINLRIRAFIAVTKSGWKSPVDRLVPDIEKPAVAKCIFEVGMVEINPRIHITHHNILAGVSYPGRRQWTQLGTGTTRRICHSPPHTRAVSAARRNTDIQSRLELSGFLDPDDIRMIDDHLQCPERDVHGGHVAQDRADMRPIRLKRFRIALKTHQRVHHRLGVFGRGLYMNVLFCHFNQIRISADQHLEMRAELCQCGRICLSKTNDDWVKDYQTDGKAQCYNEELRLSIS